jgi:mRNA interferase MazF
MSGTNVLQGDIRWVDLGDPLGSEPGYRRPVVVVQGDAFNASSLATVVCVALTTNLKWARAPGNVLLPATTTGLPKDSVANVSQIATIDLSVLEDPVSRLRPAEIKAILRGLDLMLGR